MKLIIPQYFNKVFAFDTAATDLKVATSQINENEFSIAVYLYNAIFSICYTFDEKIDPNTISDPIKYLIIVIDTQDYMYQKLNKKTYKVSINHLEEIYNIIPELNSPVPEILIEQTSHDDFDENQFCNKLISQTNFDENQFCNKLISQANFDENITKIPTQQTAPRPRLAADSQINSNANFNELFERQNSELNEEEHKIISTKIINYNQKQNDEITALLQANNKIIEESEENNGYNEDDEHNSITEWLESLPKRI